MIYSQSGYLLRGETLSPGPRVLYLDVSQVSQFAFQWAVIGNAAGGSMTSIDVYVTSFPDDGTLYTVDPAVDQRWQIEPLAALAAIPSGATDEGGLPKTASCAAYTGIALVLTVAAGPNLEGLEIAYTQRGH